MKTINEIKSVLAALIATGKTEFGTADVAEICSVHMTTIRNYIKSHPELKSAKKLPDRAGGYRWTAEEIIRLAHKMANKNTETVMFVPETITAETAITETQPMSPIDMLIAIDKTMTDDPNVKAYYDLKNKFERMNESALQRLFAPILTRFKFAYICKQIPEIQSQTLTCINKGKLRGIDKYRLSFNAFLKLIKFAHDNCVPLDAVDEQNNR